MGVCLLVETRGCIQMKQKRTKRNSIEGKAER